MSIFNMAQKENAIAAINAGEFADPGGQGTGNNPMGITYSRGKCVWNDSFKRTFIGFDKNDRLIVTEPMDKSTAEKLGIRDGVSFQNGNVLITNENGNITMHYADNNTGTAQRTAIGQCADGSVILLVTDGRSASSLGATRNDVIDVMVRYGAITAGMLDGGSSSLMYYEDYYTKYNIDENTLDQYQKKGLVNRYKAFTTPRRMPTYICVAR
jgi:exopolysaccharide biosynthesis protein